MSRHPSTDPETSRRMAGIRRVGTKPERVVAAALRALGLSYRLNVRSLPGSPDLANKRRHFAVFVRGCFWHHHTGCRRATVPKANRAFWLDKFAANRRRDATKARALRALGYRVVLVWECETTRPEALARRLAPLIAGRSGSNTGGPAG